MDPTLRSGDLLLVRGERSSGAYRAGDVALVHFLARPGMIMVKRVTAHRPDGLWVLGDNPAASDASPSYGVADPLGLVVARIWPRPALRRGLRSRSRDG